MSLVLVIGTRQKIVSSLNSFIGMAIVGWTLSWRFGVWVWNGHVIKQQHDNYYQFINTINNPNSLIHNGVPTNTSHFLHTKLSITQAQINKKNRIYSRILKRVSYDMYTMMMWVRNAPAANLSIQLLRLNDRITSLTIHRQQTTTTSSPSQLERSWR